MAGMIPSNSQSSISASIASASVMEIIDPEKLREGIAEVFARKGEKIVEMNIAAFNAGLEASKK